MDMIEGNAVRKSYQRALLILHPDKLQQKGASENQKYMAEKVFELLQVVVTRFLHEKNVAVSLNLTHIFCLVQSLGSMGPLQHSRTGLKEGNSLVF